MQFNADTKNMRLVALAFHNYESAYKRLPAPTSVDAPSSFKSARAGSSTTERNVFVVSALPTDNYRKLPMFVEGQYAQFSRVTDGAANTILAMQFTKYSQPWAQPGEVTIDRAYELLGKEPGGCLVVMLDGIVKWLPNTTSRADFNAMVTREAGDLIFIR